MEALKGNLLKSTATASHTVVPKTQASNAHISLDNQTSASSMEVNDKVPAPTSKMESST